MSLPATGAITMDQVRKEINKPSVAIGLGQADVRQLANKLTGSISMSELRGKSSYPIGNFTSDKWTSPPSKSGVVSYIGFLAASGHGSCVNPTFNNPSFHEAPVTFTAAYYRNHPGQTGNRDYMFHVGLSTASNLNGLPRGINITISGSGKTQDLGLGQAPNTVFQGLYECTLPYLADNVKAILGGPWSLTIKT